MCITVSVYIYCNNGLKKYQKERERDPMFGVISYGNEAYSINTAAPGTSHKALIVCRQVAGPCIFSTNSPPFPLFFVLCFLINSNLLSLLVCSFEEETTQSQVLCGLFYSFAFFLFSPLRFLLYSFLKQQGNAADDDNKSARQKHHNLNYIDTPAAGPKNTKNRPSF